MQDLTPFWMQDLTPFCSCDPFLLSLAALPNKCSWTLLGHLFLAIGKYGKPRAVRTDNEACFTSRLFCTLLKLPGIRHQRSELHCPWQNGRIERLFGTLKQKLDQWEVAGFKALNVSLAEFRFFLQQGAATPESGGQDACGNVDRDKSFRREVQRRILVRGVGGIAARVLSATMRQNRHTA